MFRFLILTFLISNFYPDITLISKFRLLEFNKTANVLHSAKHKLAAATPITLVPAHAQTRLSQKLSLLSTLRSQLEPRHPWH